MIKCGLDDDRLAVLAGAVLHPHLGKWIALDAKIDPGANRSVIPSWVVRAFRSETHSQTPGASDGRSDLIPFDPDASINACVTALANGQRVQCPRWLVDVCLCAPVRNRRNPWLVSGRGNIVPSSWWIRFNVITEVLARRGSQTKGSPRVDGGYLEMDRDEMLIGSDLLRLCPSLKYTYVGTRKAPSGATLTLPPGAPSVTSGMKSGSALQGRVFTLNPALQILRAPHEQKGAQARARR